ncbi:MAG: hypothetical protein ABI919_06470 [Ramlibacter sp.]
MKRFWHLVILGVAASANAGAPDKLAEVAGNQPSQAQAMQAVITELRHTMKEPRDLERVRFFSGPHLVTGVNFANGREQAWLMCVVVGDSRLSRHAPDLEVRPFLMRNRADGLKLVTQGNWTDSDAKC